MRGIGFPSLFQQLYWNKKKSGNKIRLMNQALTAFVPMFQRFVAGWVNLSNFL
jgi:hypothetical protein